MNILKREFTKNGLPYTLLKRNDVVALYGVGGTYTNEILHYEVCELHFKDDKFGRRFALPSNEQFGRDKSRAIVDKSEAIEYYDELTRVIPPPDPDILTRGRCETQKWYHSATRG